jgi:hypothetical protein
MIVLFQEVVIIQNFHSGLVSNYNNTNYDNHSGKILWMVSFFVGKKNLHKNKSYVEL